MTDEPARFAGLAQCVTWDPDGGVRVIRQVERVTRQGGDLIVKLAGIDGVDAARALRGRRIAVPESDVVPAPAGRFYPWQLEGCRVETETGQVVGEVSGIEGSPAQDVWVVLDGDRERLIPAVPEIVIEVDLQARRVVIRPPDGLLEL